MELIGYVTTQGNFHPDCLPEDLEPVESDDVTPVLDAETAPHVLLVCDECDTPILDNRS